MLVASKVLDKGKAKSMILAGLAEVEVEVAIVAKAVWESEDSMVVSMVVVDMFLI